MLLAEQLSVLMGGFGFWDSSFVLPQEVIKKVEAICRNFPLGM